MNLILRKMMSWIACQRSDDIVLFERIVFDDVDHKYKTTEILNFALDQIEVVRDWPYCIVTWNQDNARNLAVIFGELAVYRGFKIEKKELGRITLDGGAQYNFISKSLLDRWVRGFDWFCDIVEDNDVKEGEEALKRYNRRNPGKRVYEEQT